MSGYTKGPWMADGFSLSYEIRALTNPLIAVVQSRHCDSPEEMTANSILIAAAPDLLEALKEYVSQDETAQGYGYGVGGEAMQQALTAIAKAEGTNNAQIDQQAK